MMGSEVCWLCSDSFQQVSGELPAASPDRFTMASPGGGGGRRVHPLPYSDVGHSRMFPSM